MQATTTTRHRCERRKGGARRTPVPVFLACIAFVLAAVPALAASAPLPEQRRATSHAAAALAPPRAAASRWTNRPAVSAGRAKPVIHLANEVSPHPCSPSLDSAPDTGMNEGTTDSGLALTPRGGTVAALMLFVDFTDLHASESTSTIYPKLVPRARRWYKEVSYGRLHLEVTAVRRWFRMPRPLPSYGLADGISWPEHHDYIADAIDAADRSVDFSGYEVVYVVAAKGTGIERSPAFHAYPGSGIRVDGGELRQGATFFEDTKGDARFAANVLIHETGHILGLPDLYDVPLPRFWSLLRFAGGWDMMSWNDPGFHFLAWQKWKLGWLQPSQLACLDQPGQLTVTVTPLERAGGLKALVVPTSASSALVVEARRRIGQDQDLCAEGVLVYSVDASVRSGSGPVRVQAAQPDRSSELRDRCGPLYNAPFARGRGRVAHFEDDSAGISVSVLGSGPTGYRVRVRRI
jgi:M6 family metalloprotease-like protein